MILFENLTYLNGGSPRRARNLGAYYLPDTDETAEKIRTWHPKISLEIQNQIVVGVTEVSLPEEQTNPQEEASI